MPPTMHKTQRPIFLSAIARGLAIAASASWIVACSETANEDQNGDPQSDGTGGTTSGSDTGGAGGATQGHPVPDDIPRPPSDLDGCYSCLSFRSTPDSDEYSVRYHRYDYNVSHGTLSQHEVEQPAEDSPPLDSLHYRVDSAGWLVTYAGVTTGGFRHDYFRDDQHNVTGFEFVYEDWTDLSEPTTADPYMYYTYSHSYDANGALESSTLVDSDYITATAISYVHDSGRCASIETTYSGDQAPTLRTFAYENGRLASSTTATTLPESDELRRIVTTYSYDGQGRLVAIEQDGGGHWSANADGTPDVVEYWFYDPDRSWVHEVRDYTTDIPNDEVEVDGQLRTCGRSMEAFSAACADVSELIPEPDTSLECRFESGRSVPLRDPSWVVPTAPFG